MDETGILPWQRWRPGAAERRPARGDERYYAPAIRPPAPRTAATCQEARQLPIVEEKAATVPVGLSIYPG